MDAYSIAKRERIIKNLHDRIDDEKRRKNDEGFDPDIYETDPRGDRSVVVDDLPDDEAREIREAVQRSRERKNYAGDNVTRH